MDIFWKLLNKILFIFKKRKTRFLNDNIIVKKIKGSNFIFDKESLKEYEIFADDYHTIIIQDGYLARKQKASNGYTTFFHLWLMQKEIEKFKEKNNYYGKMEVHHENGKNDNRKHMLRCMRKLDHRRIIHNQKIN